MFQTFIQEGLFADFLHAGDVVVASADDAGHPFPLDLVLVELECRHCQGSCRLHDDGALVVHMYDGRADRSLRNDHDVVKNFLADFISVCSCLLNSSSVHELVDLRELHHSSVFYRSLHARGSTRLHADHFRGRGYLLDV